MLDSYCLWPHIRVRIASGPLAHHVDIYVALLEKHGYRRKIVRRHIRAIDILGAWLSKRATRLAATKPTTN